MFVIVAINKIRPRINISMYLRYFYLVFVFFFLINCEFMPYISIELYIFKVYVPLYKGYILMETAVLHVSICLIFLYLVSKSVKINSA